MVHPLPNRIDVGTTGSSMKGGFRGYWQQQPVLRQRKSSFISLFVVLGIILLSLPIAIIASSTPVTNISSSSSSSAAAWFWKKDWKIWSLFRSKEVTDDITTTKTTATTSRTTTRTTSTSDPIHQTDANILNTNN
jgi:hypothetical protein